MLALAFVTAAGIVAGGVLVVPQLVDREASSTSDEDGQVPVAQGGVTISPSPLVASPVPSLPALSPSPPLEPAHDFADLYQEVGPGVLMVRATTCEGTGGGSAFLISDGRIVTAAHVVAEAAAVAVMKDDSVYQAVVVGTDEVNDIAVLDITGQLDSHVFEFADTTVSAGESLAVIGHPLGDPLTINAGTASRVDAELWPAFQIDASVNPGNSGGPVVRADGEVVGMLVAKNIEAEGLAYAVRAEVIAERVANPDLLATPPAPNCGTPLGPEESDEVPEIAAADDLGLAVATTLASYFDGINSGDYQLAFDQLSPRLQGSMSVENFAAGVVTSFDFGFDVLSVEETSDGALVWLEFVSLQAPEYGPDGEACTSWSLDYQLTWDDYGWLLIDRVTGHGDTSGHVPCS